MRSALVRHPVTAAITFLVVATAVFGIVVRVLHGADPASYGPFRIFAASTGAVALLTTIAGVVVLVGAAERLMGSWRTALAFVVTTVVGTAAGALTAFVDTDGRDLTGLLLGRATAFDPWTAIVGRSSPRARSPDRSGDGASG